MANGWRSWRAPTGNQEQEKQEQEKQEQEKQEQEKQEEEGFKLSTQKGHKDGRGIIWFTGR